MKICPTGAIASEPDGRDILSSGIIPEIKRRPVEFLPPFDLTVSNQRAMPSCFPSQTLVLTEDFSYKPISSIRVGDLVFTHKGRPRMVTETMKRNWQGTTKIIKISGDYREIEATQEHPFYAIKRPKNASGMRIEELISEIKPSFFPLSELKKNDWLAMPFNNYTKDKTIYSFERDPEFLWTLGLYLAEGSLKKSEVVFSLHIKEIYFYERIKATMEKYGANVSYSLNEKDNGLTVRINGEKWSKIFLELGDKYCDKKSINKRLMFLDPSLQMKIYEGVLDGDGCILQKKDRNRKTKNIISTSQELLLQLRTILLRNGIYSSIQKRKKRDDRKEVWVLEVYEKPLRSFVKEGYVFSPIKDVKIKSAFSGGYVYNLEVEEDNSYIVNSVAVHNCVGHTSATIKQFNEFKERNDLMFDGDWIYSEAKKIDGIPNFDGTYLRTGMKVLYDKGAKVFNEPSDPSKYRIGAYARVDNLTADSIKNHILIYGTVMAGFTGSNEGWQGVTVRPHKAGENTWGHAVAIVGYDKDHIIGQNSWGEGRHNRGLFKVPNSYLPFEAWVALSDMPNQPLTAQQGGWVAGEFLNWIGGKLIATHNLNVRQEPSLSGRVLKTIPRGTEIKLIDQQVINRDRYTWRHIELV